MEINGMQEGDQDRDMIENYDICYKRTLGNDKTANISLNMSNYR